MNSLIQRTTCAWALGLILLLSARSEATTVLYTGDADLVDSSGAVVVVEPSDKKDFVVDAGSGLKHEVVYLKVLEVWKNSTGMPLEGKSVPALTYNVEMGNRRGVVFGAPKYDGKSVVFLEPSTKRDAAGNFLYWKPVAMSLGVMKVFYDGSVQKVARNMATELHVVNPRAPAPKGSARSALTSRNEKESEVSPDADPNNVKKAHDFSDFKSMVQHRAALSGGR